MRNEHNRPLRKTRLVKIDTPISQESVQLTNEKILTTKGDITIVYNPYDPEQMKKVDEFNGTGVHSDSLSQSNITTSPPDWLDSLKPKPPFVKGTPDQEEEFRQVLGEDSTALPSWMKSDENNTK